MKEYKITVPGTPIAKGRPRARIVTKRTGGQFISFYTPKETEIYEESVKWYAKASMKGHCPINEACEVSIIAYMPIPPSWSKKKTQEVLHDTRHISKPDNDNLIKILGDGMNGIVYTDDAKIWRIVCEKHYSINPRVEIIIKTCPPTLKEI